MPGHDIIVLGASAGGVEALSKIVQGLPSDLPAAVFVCLHIPSYSTSILPDILQRKGRLPASHPRDNEEIRPGRIYIAPPDRHLLLRPGHVRVTRGARENGHRPAIDPLFRSAARYYGNRVVGVVLSGTLDDGTAGLSVIKQFGGVAVVQDPQDALFSGMPQSAIDNVRVDHVVGLDAIPALLDSLARQRVPEATDRPDLSADDAHELEIAERDMEGLQTADRAGTPSSFTCPECHGALWEVREGQIARFRCRTGHAYSADSLISEQTYALENALWAALRALEEKRQLADRLADRSRERGFARAAEQFTEQARESNAQAATILAVLQQGPNLHLKEPSDDLVEESVLNAD